jgi:hypothetical protein
MRFPIAPTLWLALVTLASPPLLAQAVTTAFSGVPSQKVSEAGNERRAEKITRHQSANLGCVVSEIGGKFYWATRGNKELVRIASGAFVTYVSVDGSGYVRVVGPDAKAAASAMSPTEAKFDYRERILVGLRSVTYYGNVQ